MSFLFLDIHISITPVALERDFGNYKFSVGEPERSEMQELVHQVLFLLQKDQKVLILTEKLNSLLKLGDALPASPTKTEQTDLE